MANAMQSDTARDITELLPSVFPDVSGIGRIESESFKRISSVSQAKALRHIRRIRRRANQDATLRKQRVQKSEHKLWSDAKVFQHFREDDQIKRAAFWPQIDSMRIQ
jgi:hypothetical protein